MNLSEVITQTDLRNPVKLIKPKTRTAIQVARRVFQLAAQGGFPYKNLTSEQWANKWLGSPEFRLMEIDYSAAAELGINAAASPHAPKNPNRVQHYVHCSVESLDPIVVDVNKRKVGRSYLGYLPPVVVLDGKHRKKAQLQQGRTRILAWVGCKALKQIPENMIHEVDECLCKNNPKGKEVYLPPSESTKISAAYEIHCATVPSVGIPAVRQDSGEGGSRPKDFLHSGGPGSGRKPGDVLKQNGWRKKDTVINQDMYHNKNLPNHSISLFVGTKPGGYNEDRWTHYNGSTFVKQSVGGDSLSEHLKSLKASNKFEAMGGPGLSNQGGANDVNMKACGPRDPLIKTAGGSGARSSGSYVDDSSTSDDRVPPDASDAGTRMEDSSDQLKYSRQAKMYAPGTYPGYSNQFGMSESTGYANLTGQRVKNTGGSKSDFSRVMAKGKTVKKIWNKKKN